MRRFTAPLDKLPLSLLSLAWGVGHSFTIVESEGLSLFNPD